MIALISTNYPNYSKTESSATGVFPVNSSFNVDGPLTNSGVRVVTVSAYTVYYTVISIPIFYGTPPGNNFVDVTGNSALFNVC
jgi:hypothetical protein